MAAKKSRLVGSAIRRARAMCGLTQAQLGSRLGLKGGAQAVYRWERGMSAPTRRTRKALLDLLRVLSPQAATSVETAMDAAAKAQAGASRPSGTHAQASATVAERSYPLRRPEALEFLVLRMADEMDVPARRVRTPLARLLRNLRASDFTLATVPEELDAWIASMEAPPAAAEHSLTTR